MLAVGKFSFDTDVVDFAGVSIRAYVRDGLQFSKNRGARRSSAWAEFSVLDFPVYRFCSVSKFEVARFHDIDIAGRGRFRGTRKVVFAV